MQILSEGFIHSSYHRIPYISMMASYSVILIYPCYSIVQDGIKLRSNGSKRTHGEGFPHHGSAIP